MVMKKYKAVIFDLDGTLTYTLEDLCRSVNHALRSCGMRERTLNEVRQFVGNGVRKLMERAVPLGTSSEEFERCFSMFREYYVLHCQDNTVLYDGIEDMLAELHRRGIPMAIVSNKLQAGVDELADRFYGKYINVAIGERQGIPRKPAPDMVHLAMLELGVSVDETVYIGDSDVDIDTALAAGLPCISVLWGFRDREFLIEHGATQFVSHPSELLDYFLLE